MCLAIKRGFITLLAAIVMLVGVYPKVSADDAIVPIIPIAEGILAYILAAATGAAYVTANNDNAGSFGKVDNYDDEVKTLALGWARIASHEIKEWAYDAWDSAYKAGTMIQLPQFVKEWITGEDKMRTFLRTTAMETFLHDSGWTIRNNGIDSTRRTYQFIPDIDNNKIFYTVLSAYGDIYASRVTAQYYWTGMLRVYLDEVGTGRVIEFEGDWTTRQYTDGNKHYQVDDPLAVGALVQSLGMLKQVDGLYILQNIGAIGAAIPDALPAPMPKDFIIQGEGDDAMPVGFPIPKPKTVTDKTTGLDKDVVTVPIGGVDTDVITGDKVGDGVANPPIDWSLEGILQGIEGIIAKIGDIAITIGEWFDLTKPIDWSPMRNLATPLTRTFPFSLPWDIGRMIDELTKTPTPPDFEAEMLINGKTYKQKIEVLAWFSTFAPIIRAGVLILFTLGLVFAVTRLYGGAK